MADGKGPAARDAYARAGVDVAAGDRAVALMAAHVASTRRPEVVGGIGGFGGAVAVPAGYREPILVSSTDGVGTKTAIASGLGRYDTIGVDLVAMCADDVVCSGARPLFFLDYVAVGRLDPAIVASIVGGVAAGCREAGCALVGGETAEHPGLIDPPAFDLAGCCVGVVERERLIDGSRADEGDLVIGLAASGLHANGYSLVRTVLAAGGPELALDAPYRPLLGRVFGSGVDSILAADAALGIWIAAEATLGDVLLAPTRIYTQAIVDLLDGPAGVEPHGIAHVTGGGLPGNAARAVRAHLGVRLDPARWSVPSAIRLVGKLAGLGDAELRATLNGGLGMLVVVGPSDVRSTIASFARSGVPAWLVGEIVSGASLGGVRYAEGTVEGVTG